MKLQVFITIPLILVAYNQFIFSSEISPEQHRFFENQIRPLLIKRCYECHGPDDQAGNLRVDSRQGLISGGESGASIVPGQPNQSLLMEAVRYESYEMPPSGQIPQEEINLLERWIQQGAPWPGDTGKPIHTTQPVEKITEEDRNYWAFQPIRKPVVPHFQDDSWSLNEIDHFIQQKLMEKSLSPSPHAGRLMLIRRLYFDLIGLPPSPQEVNSFLNDPSPSAYEMLVDDLLNRPQFGEKWARHWLDLVRYAESDGFRQDAFRRNAWHYRDYVIRAFNADKPYDQFLSEQLAGDEIAPDDPDAIAATGYLRHGIYEYNQRDARTQWQDILNDITDTTGDVFLGLGMGCARCHDHKFDPILQTDYFALQSFFAAIMPKDDLVVASRELKSQHQQQIEAWESATESIRAELEQIEQPLKQSLAKAAIIMFPTDIQAIMNKPTHEREPLEHQLADLVHRQILDRQNRDLSKRIPKDKKARWEELQEELKQHNHLKPKSLPTTRGVADVGTQAPVIHLDANPRKPIVPPGYLTVLGDLQPEINPLTDSTGRRTALANWLVSENHPLTARVMVNRLWQYLFGRGLATNASDFGLLGEPPSHPKLLDYLAYEFRERGWSMKTMIKMMVMSATYQQQSLTGKEDRRLLKDPDNIYLWRMTPRRLSSEQIRDAILLVTGNISDQQFGPSVSESSSRRSIYIKNIRNRQAKMMSVFDAPRGITSNASRNVTTTAPQSLFMLNGPWVLSQAQKMAKLIWAESGNNHMKAIRLLGLKALGRELSNQEISLFRQYLSQDDLDDGSNFNLSKFFSPIPDRNDLALNFTSEIKQPLIAIVDKQPNQGEIIIETTFHQRSRYPDASVRTLVSQWNGNNQQAGWSIGVTSTKSAYQPGHLILQIVGNNSQGQRKYEVVTSDQFIELNQTYHIRVAIQPQSNDLTNVIFSVTNITEYRPERITENKSKVLTGYIDSNVPIVIGGRSKSTHHRWDGWMDDLELNYQSHHSTTKDQLTTYRWNFNDQSLVASSTSDTTGHLLPASQSQLSRDQQKLADLCHVILNSNEFIHLD